MAKRQRKKISKPAKPIKAPKRAKRSKPAISEKRHLPAIEHKPEQDDDGYGDDGLKLRWRAFVEAYTGPAGGNASKAAEMAGYAAENRIALAVTASRLLRNAKVSRAIALSFAAKNVTPEWCQKRLCDIAQADMNNFVTVDDAGMAQLDLKKAESLGAIGQIKEYDVERGKLKLHDPTPALTMLMKMFGMLSEKHEHSGPGGGPIQIQTENLDHLSADDLAQLREIRLKLLAGAGPNPN